MSRSVKITLALIIGVVSFLFFLIFLFPMNTAVNSFLADFEKQSKGQYRISVGGMDASLLFSSKLQNLRIEQKNNETFEELLLIPSGKVSFSLFSLISKKMSFHFDSQFHKGSVKGKIDLAIKDKAGAVIEFVDIKFINFDISQIGAIQLALKNLVIPFDKQKKSNLSFALTGVVDGSFFYSLAQGTGAQAIDSTFELKIGDFALKDFNLSPTAKQPVAAEEMSETEETGETEEDSAELAMLDPTQMKLVIPEIVLAQKGSPAEFVGDIQNAQVTLTKISLPPGADLELALEGRLRVDRSFEIIWSSLIGKFLFSKKMNDKIPVLSFLESAKTPEGFIPLRIEGSWRKRLPRILLGDINITQFLSP